MTTPFEEFLQNKHAELYIGLDDEMPDSFNNWVSELDDEDWIALGNEFGGKV